MSVEFTLRDGKIVPGRISAADLVPDPEVLRAWLELTPFRPDPKLMDRNRVVTMARLDRHHLPIDILRTKLMKIIREKGWTRIAVTSPTAGCGKSTLSLNLAFSLARQSNFRLALMDFDMRQPGIARLLGCTQPPSLEQFLRGEATMGESVLRVGNTLAVAPNGARAPNAAELLQDLVKGSVLQDMQRRLALDLLVFDLPPMLANDDVLSILPAVDGVVLVAAAEQSSFNEIDVCERDLANEDKLIGVVLNKCRYNPEKYGY